MKFIFVIFVLLFSSYTFALDKIPFLLYLDTGNRIHMIADETSYQAIHGFNQYWGWERTASYIQYVKDEQDTFEIKWQLDIMGSACPDWYTLTLKDSCYGTDVKLERQHGSWQNPGVYWTTIESLHYSDYESFLSAEYWGPAKYFLLVMLERTKQDLHLPHLQVYDYFFDYTEELTPEISKTCIELIDKLDDPDPKIRDDATFMLTYSQYFIHLKEVTKRVDLSPEQYIRVEFVLDSYPATEDWQQAKKDVVVSFVYYYYYKMLFGIDDWVRSFKHIW